MNAGCCPFDAPRYILSGILRNVVWNRPAPSSMAEQRLFLDSTTTERATDGEQTGRWRNAVKEKIASFSAFQEIAARLHDIIMRSAPDLKPRLWYGMPGYAKAKSSPVICFFRVDDHHFVTFGLTEKANLAPDESAGHQLIGSALVSHRPRRTDRGPHHRHCR